MGVKPASNDYGAQHTAKDCMTKFASEGRCDLPAQVRRSPYPASQSSPIEARRRSAGLGVAESDKGVATLRRKRPRQIAHG